MTISRTSSFVSARLGKSTVRLLTVTPTRPAVLDAAGCEPKVAANWVVTGAARWDLVANQINQYVIGAGYVDDCFVLAANYVTSYSYATATSPPLLGHAYMLQVGLRTLASTTQ